VPGNQALSAILFLCQEVLHKEIEPVLLSGAKRPERLPTVITRTEVMQVLSELNGVKGALDFGITELRDQIIEICRSGHVHRHGPQR
jgi:hypothetical protein